MKSLSALFALFSFALLLACTNEQSTNDPHADLGINWVKHSAEYQALSLQVYESATAALPAFIEDTSWSALPGQTDAANLPTAVILDVDETIVSNVDFQLSYERPFDNWKLNEWTSATNATPIAGVREFVAAARALGVTVFFVTNRPCELIADNDDPCPQKLSTIDDIMEIGIETDVDHVMLSEEHGWTREKSSRRDFVSATHRVIMLFGDDLNDFVACTRTSPKHPCTVAATKTSRAEAVVEYRQYWGNGWYILPNPMHGSWTSAR